MLLDGWFILGLLAVCGLAGAVAGLVSFVGAAVVRRRVTSLEFTVADLEERLLREIKTRAAHLGVKARKADDELVEQLVLKNNPTKSDQPWWMEHVHPDLKK